MADEAKTEQISPTTEEGEEIDDEDRKRYEEERCQAEEMLKEAETKAAARLELKQRNTNADKLRPTGDDLRKLDGSVKKNSGFVKKLRNISEQQRAALVKDLNSLNLTKYVAEAANSIAEAKLKVSDVGCAVHICSLLHQRYVEFSPELLEQLQKIYSTGIGKDEDKSAVSTKYRLGVRLTGELLLAGVIDEEIGCSLLMDMVAMVTKADKEGHPYLSVVLNFCRHCSEDIAGIVPRRQRQLMAKFDIHPPKSQLLPVAKQEQFRTVLQEYFSCLRTYLVKEHRAMHKREKQNYQILTSKGEISEQRRLENDTAQKLYDKLLSNTSTLAELLDEDMPDLPEFVAPQEQSDISIELQFPSGIADASEADPNSLWEDEDTRSFYEGITDIKPFVPSILYEGRKKTSSESSDGAQATEENSSEALPAEEDEEKVLEQLIKDTEEATIDDEVGVVDLEEEGSGQGVEPGASALLDEFITRLPTLMNRKFVDEFAVEFCMTMNSKANRKKLARALFNVDRNRMDLIPFYARLAATLHPCLDDIAATLIDILVRDLRFQIKKKDQVHIHSKLKNVRFLAELTKFGLCPKAETMKCITLLLHDFTHHNLEMACLFIEHCGRYLIRSPDSHLRAKALLEIMVRKKRVQNLDGRQRSLVENALYYANPPETPQIVHVSLPLMLQYIQKLLYKDLNKNNTEKVLKQMRKLPWSESEVFQWAVTSLTQIWNVKFNNVHCVANLLAGLKPYQEDAVIRVVDGVLEDIRLGLELNIPKMNQRRFAGMKFLGELYSYQLVESNVVFRTLYLMLQFGATPDGRPSPLDRQDSYFRVRLICILLDTCGHYFDHGSTKKKLDAFLVFFQCYLFTKRQPLPLEVDHMIQDSVEALRPDLQLFKSHQEAVEAAIELEKKYKDKIGHEDEDGEDSDDEEDERSGGPLHDEDEGEEDEEGEGDGEGDGEEMEEDAFDDANQLLDEEPEPVLKTAPRLMACPEDDEFLSAYEKMMTDEIQTSRTDATKVPVIDTAVPMHLKGPKVKQRPLVHEEGELRMKFTLMTKKGHKQQLKDVAIPIDSDLASNIHEAREALRDQHQELKKLVLNYEQKQEEEEYQAMVAKEREEIRKAKQASLPQKKQQPAAYQPQSHQQPLSFSDAYEGSNSPRGRGGSQYSYKGRGRGSGGGRSYYSERPYSSQQGNNFRGGGGGGTGGGSGHGDRQKRGGKSSYQSQPHHSQHHHQHNPHHHHHHQQQQGDQQKTNFS